MSKYLNGRDLADFVKVRQAKQVRGLRQARRIFPKLAIITTVDSPVTNTYIRLKESYGEDILVDVDVHRIEQGDIRGTVERLNSDDSVHAVIIQLPLADDSYTADVLNLVSPVKDVDGLGEASKFDPATPVAINWLLAGYNVDLGDKEIAVVGQGRLVGEPLARMWRNSGYKVTTFDEHNQEQMLSSLSKYDVVVTATGVPGLITDSLVKFGCVVVDAGTASDNGKIVGDVADEVRERSDITITPVKGGVGPLTVAALFDNVIRAAAES